VTGESKATMAPPASTPAAKPLDKAGVSKMPAQQ